MRLYLSGPMTGYPALNFPAFLEAARELRARGHEVINPAELGEHDGWTWEQYLRRDIKAMLDCEGIVMLPGWVNSKGASLEYDIANRLGMKAMRLVDALEAR